jgi:hypothetical protein
VTPTCSAAIPVPCPGRSPHVGSAVRDVDLSERERDEAHLPISARGQPDKDVFVRVACKGAAVVPRHREFRTHA